MDKTNLSFTDDDLIQVAHALSDRHENVGTRWDEAREDDHESADYWRQQYEHVGRLHRRALAARRRLARKVTA